MIKQPLIPSDLLAIRRKVKEEKPLIHCITNPISINDCANIVLAVGAKPIMAEHPAEVSEITLCAKALAVNLGNITDARLTSMLISGAAAKKANIPSIIDIVGVGCSTLRLNFAQKYIRDCRPNVIKGNISEFKALCGVKCEAKGIDAGDSDIVTAEHNLDMLKTLAEHTDAIVLATGIVDIITDGKNTYLIKNGCAMLSMITGTGCMLNALTASFISSGDIIGGVILATAFMGICGEISQSTKGTGTFKTALLDSFFSIADQEILDKIKLEFL